MSTVGFAPVNKPSYPKCGTPPINPDRNEMNRGHDILIEKIREKSPLLAELLNVQPCDSPERGGISGNMNKKPNDSLICYLA